MENSIKSALEESMEVKKALLDSTQMISDAIQLIADALCSGKKVLLMGNGGSAADAQHIAGELVGRFKMERNAMPAIALSTDTSILTAIGNDYGFEYVFSRQVEALADKGDVVFGLSTSGNSENVYQALTVAKGKGAVTLSMVGENGGKIKDLADLSIVVPSTNTPRIQEAHITIGHIICCEVEKIWAKK